MSMLEHEDWTAEERSFFARLPRDAELREESEERLMLELRERGLLGDVAGGVRRARRREIALRLALLATAASFLLGLLVGRASAPGGAGMDNTPPFTTAGAQDSSLVTLTRIIAM